MCGRSFVCIIKRREGSGGRRVKKQLGEGGGGEKSERRRIRYRTFLQTHVYHARLAQLQEEVLVFLILLIVNNFHVNYFAARGTTEGK